MNDPKQKDPKGYCRSCSSWDMGNVLDKGLSIKLCYCKIHKKYTKPMDRCLDWTISTHKPNLKELGEKLGVRKSPQRD